MTTLLWLSCSLCQSRSNRPVPFESSDQCPDPLNGLPDGGNPSLCKNLHLPGLPGPPVHQVRQVHEVEMACCHSLDVPTGSGGVTIKLRMCFSTCLTCSIPTPSVVVPARKITNRNTKHTQVCLIAIGRTSLYGANQTDVRIKTAQ